MKNERNYHVDAVPALAGERRFEASAILYLGIRCGLGVLAELGLAFADELEAVAAFFD